MLTPNEQKFAAHRQRILDEREKHERRVEADLEKMFVVILAIGLVAAIFIKYIIHNF